MKWLYDRYLLTPIVGLYYMALMGFGTIQLFTTPADITGPGAAAYATLMGLPALGLIKWRLSNGIPKE